MASQLTVISPAAVTFLDRDVDAHKLERDSKRQIDHNKKWALGEALATKGIKSVRPEKRPAR